MKNKIVSIIIPSFNRADFIGETIKSILGQTYNDLECIVVDDGSTDNTKLIVNDIAKNDSRIKYYERPFDRPKGANACRNFGFEVSQGAYVNWMDSDDIMHKEKLSIQLEALESNNKNISICKSFVFEDSFESSVAMEANNIISDNPAEGYLTKEVIIPIQAPIFRKSFLLEHQFKFDESLQAGQEWELFSRILLEDADYIPVDRHLDYIRKHHSSISGNIRHDQRWNYFVARYKINRDCKDSFSLRIKNYFSYFFLKTYKEFLRSGHYSDACFVWRKCLLGDHKLSLKDQFLLGLSWMTFFLFKKGDVFLSKVSSFKNQSS